MKKDLLKLIAKIPIGIFFIITMINSFYVTINPLFVIFAISWLWLYLIFNFIYIIHTKQQAFYIRNQFISGFGRSEKDMTRSLVASVFLFLVTGIILMVGFLDNIVEFGVMLVAGIFAILSIVLDKYIIKIVKS